MLFFDPLYLIMIAPALILSMWASAKTKGAFRKYGRVSVRLTGAQAARVMLDQAGLVNVAINRGRGFLSDHYNPATRSLSLSPDVYDKNSVAAIGVACHEAGHAVQHASAYPFLQLRSTLVPTANIGSTLGYLVIIGGFILQMQGLLWVGILLFSATVLFQLVTLPVEFDASNRAKAWLSENRVVSPQQRQGVDAVLNAAAWTYVAAAASSLMTLLYFVLRAGGSND
ncbi:MAG: zinc metallopeptidase [Bacteroidota bacterium]|nr:zinc metallopeptidase [Bacteroidota bacterium]MDE2835018.1 zinc metallopeptidase [Bacteroidota bacterium]MDE2956004.1 zinc metallopeptidase [Bacteroidota bacterium]